MNYDAIIAGGGPVGMLLACELKLAGISVLVVERREEIDPTVKAGAINVPSVEAFDRRGMVPQLQEAQRQRVAQMFTFVNQQSGAVAAPKPPPKFAGHFGGIMLSADRMDASDPAFTERGPVDSAGFVSQQDIERVLGERAAELGVSVWRGTEVTGFTPGPEAVTVEAGGRTVTAGWLVGCDGGRSRIRKLAGFAFPGSDPEITGRQAMVDIEDAEGLGTGWNRTERGTYAYGPTPGRILTVEFDGPPVDRDAPITAAELQHSLRRVSGVDITITGLHTATRFTDNTRQAATYRLGRVLLAGDAAHVHPPFGGQGLNLGLGDAMNLGWKLAATVQGWGPDGLLDTYTSERHPIGAWVLDWTRAQVAFMRTDERTRALRGVIGELMDTVTGTTYFVKKISGVWQHYDLGGGHELVGASAPELNLSGRRLAGHLHDGKGVLVDLADDAGARAAAEPWRDRVQVVSGTCPERPQLSGLLIRPDGHVVWAADGAPDTARLEHALATWFGAGLEAGGATAERQRVTAR